MQSALTRRGAVVAISAGWVALTAASADAVVGWDDVALAAGSALLSYLTRGTRDQGQLTKEELERALDDRFNDLKLYVQEVMHKEILLGQSREVTANCSTASDYLADVRQNLQSGKRDSIANNLHDAKFANREAINLSSTLGPLGIPGYVVGGSQSISIAAYEAKFSRDRGVLSQFVLRELRGQRIPALRKMLEDYKASLSPDLRLGAIQYDRPRPDDAWRGGASRPDTEFYVMIDGYQHRTLEQDKIENADDWDTLHGLAATNEAQPRAELEQFRVVQIRDVYQPAMKILIGWEKMSKAFA
jgi:hypothetical protein